jgi:hypothetical protein
MKKLRHLLPLALVSAAIAAPVTNAGPSPIRVSVSSNAQYLSPTSIVVQVTVTCPTGQTAFGAVSVQEQNATNATGSSAFNVACTGRAETLGVLVNGTGFTPGKAYAQAYACTFFCDFPGARQIQIVV